MGSAKLIVGVNDLLSQRPDIASEWDYELNSPLRPEMVTKGSKTQVWFRCNKGYPHSYRASIQHRTARNDGCPYCSGHRLLKGFNDLATKRPDIAKYWDYEKNFPLTPSDVMPSARGKYWFKCERNQPHSYYVALEHKTSANGSNCPYCSSEKVLEGFNDLATLRPDMLISWDFTKNKINPKGVNVNSHADVWWLCEKGHSYHAKIYNRTKVNATTCPYCANKKVLQGFNDLQTKFPEIAKEWDYAKNAKKPSEVLSGSQDRYYWVCPKGHSYKTKVKERTGKDKIGCPYCAGKKVLVGFNDLATLSPTIAKEWDYSKNNGMLPTEITNGSNKKVWWICSKGHSFEQQVLARTSREKKGCPYCAGKQVLVGFNDLITTVPGLLDEWNMVKNTDVQPTDLTKGSHKKVWWICKKCGYEWQTSVHSRVNTLSGCPYCNRSKTERFCENLLSKWKMNYKAEYRFKQYEEIASKKYDFYLKDLKLIIELDGEQHFDEDSYHNKFKPFEILVESDNLKNNFAFTHGIPILRIPYTYNPIIQKDKKEIVRLLADFVKTKTIPQEIIDFYEQYEFSNYAPLARKWNETRG